MTDARVAPSALVAPVAWTAVLVAVSVVDPAVFGLAGGGGGTGAGAGGVLAVDKVAHLLGYAVLALLLARALAPDSLRAWAAVVLVPTAVGALVELLQAGVPARTTSLGDGVANAVGAVLGAVVALALRRARSRTAE